MTPTTSPPPACRPACCSCAMPMAATTRTKRWRRMICSPPLACWRYGWPNARLDEGERYAEGRPGPRPDDCLARGGGRLRRHDERLPEIPRRYLPAAEGGAEGGPGLRHAACAEGQLRHAGL